jgi:hypothetical protein
MSNPATNMNGGLVKVGDQVTIHGACTTITETTPNVNDHVTFTTTLGDVVSVLAGGLRASDQQPIVPYYGRTTDAGKAFQASDAAVIDGVVQSVTPGPWGFTGVLTVKTDFSGALITVSSGSVDSHG